MGCSQSCPAAISDDSGSRPTIQRIDDIDGKGIQIAFFFSIFAAILSSAATLLLNRLPTTPWRRRLLRGLRSLLLSLSDQQLITGLAMTVTAYTRVCSIQVFNFLVAWHMATLSFAVHCLTLLTLRDSFHDAARRGRRGDGDGPRPSPWPVGLRLVLVLANALAVGPPLAHSALTGGRLQDLLAAPAACLLSPDVLRSASAHGIVAFSLTTALAIATCVMLGVYLFRRMPTARDPPSPRRFIPLAASFLVVVVVVFMLVTTGILVWGPPEPGLVFEDDDDSWGFGQILAIFLLMLTALQVLPVELEGPVELERPVELEGPIELEGRPEAEGRTGRAAKTNSGGFLFTNGFAAAIGPGTQH